MNKAGDSLLDDKEEKAMETEDRRSRTGIEGAGSSISSMICEFRVACDDNRLNASLISCPFRRRCGIDFSRQQSRARTVVK